MPKETKCRLKRPMDLMELLSRTANLKEGIYNEKDLTELVLY